MSATTIPAGINLSVLAGTLSRPPEVRDLPSGSSVLELQLSIHNPDGPAESVPVSWFDAPASAVEWPAGQQLVVVGRVRRRFFRAGGATASRTEVVAATVLPARRRTVVGKAIQEALGAVESALVP